MFRPYLSQEGSLWYRGSIGPVEVDRADGVIEFGKWLSKAIDLRGWFGIDVIEDQRGDWWLLEVNPRWCASMELIDLSYGKTSRWIECQRRVCQADPLGDTLSSATGKLFAKRIVYAKRNLEVLDNRKFLKARSRSYFADIPASGTTIRAGDPVVTHVREIYSPAEFAHLFRTHFSI
jgi:predicted ATP-grasp superfamily ATP-dependent carboligase